MSFMQKKSFIKKNIKKIEFEPFRARPYQRRAKKEKGLARDVLDPFAAHSGLVYDVTDAVSWALMEALTVMPS